jgi:hypothetical protein
MSHEDLLSVIRQRPFVPFRLVTTGVVTTGRTA